MGWTRAETDVAEVMIWLRSNHGREVSYADIAAGVGIKDGARLRRAVKVARVVAANRSDRLEKFLPSQNPARRTMATAVDECITKVSGIDKVGPQVVKQENTGLLAQMIAALEARLTETAG
ncbi:hypothetical protein ABT294_41645 [Nonomuraea sp. NPDC000554]|uniref:hypothetical protein n=1 Tax=Nonomuraea sp. NPDC000554 TaxID=3154259 RepID=UPI0033342367